LSSRGGFQLACEITSSDLALILVGELKGISFSPSVEFETSITLFAVLGREIQICEIACFFLLGFVFCILNLNIFQLLIFAQKKIIILSQIIKLIIEFKLVILSLHILDFWFNVADF